MDEILQEERRDALIEKFTHVAKADVLTNADALAILDILGQACRRASAGLEEDILAALIDGVDDPTPGPEEEK